MCLESEIPASGDPSKGVNSTQIKRSQVALWRAKLALLELKRG